MKPKFRHLRSLALVSSVMLSISSADAVNLYWDGNSTTAGAGNTTLLLNQVWGTFTGWNTDSTGGAAGTLQIGTTNADDLFFVAGPSATSGNVAYNPTVSGAQVAKSLTFQAPAATTISSGTSITLGNGTSGVGGITMNQFAFGSTAQGAVTISTAITLANSQTWTNNSAATLTTGSIAAGTNTLTFAGSGSYAFNGSSTFTGTTAGINFTGSGFLNLRNVTAPTTSGTWTVSGGGRLLHEGNLGTAQNISISSGYIESFFNTNFSRAIGTGANQIQFTGGVSGISENGDGSTVNFGGAGATLQWGTATFSPTQFLLGASTMQSNSIRNTNLTLTNGIDLNNGARTIRQDQADGQAVTTAQRVAPGSTINGNIIGTGGGSLTKEGVGRLTLAGTNTYNGGTTITNGTLRFTNLVSMPATGAVAVGTGTTIGISVGSAGQWTTGTSGVGTVGGLLLGSGGQGSSTVGYTGTVGVELINSTNQTYAGNIANVGTTLNFIKSGAGILTLSGANTYTGTTRVFAGTLQFATPGSLYNGTTGSWTPANINVQTGATLAVNVGGTGQFTTGNISTLLAGLNTTSSLTNGLNSGAAFGFDTTNAPGTVAYSTTIANPTGTMAGTLGVTKLGLGTLTLSGTQSYTGTTTLNAGTLNMSGTFGNHPITVNGGLLNFTSSSGGNGLVTINGGTFRYAGTKTAGSTSMTAGTLQIGTANAAGLGAITLVGTISSDSTTARTVSNRIIFNGANTLGDPLNNGKLTFTDATNTSTVGSAVRVVTVLSDAEFAVGFANGGGGGITKQGFGTLTLSGGNSPYTGTTIVNAGLFALGNGGNLNGATNVTVNSTGTFGIRQNASGTTNTVGGTASTFTLATNSALSMADGFTTTLNLAGSGAASLAPASGAGVVSPVLTFDLVGASRDLLAITGVATAGTAGARIAISPSSTPNAGSSYTVITGTGASALSTNISLANALLPTASGLMSLSLSTSTGTAAIVSVANDANALYWSGATDGDWNTAGNWNTSVAGGVVSGSAPGATTDVAFSTTNPVAANLSNSLSAPLTVNSINFLPGTGAVTIGGSAITVSTNINDNSATNQTINAPLAVTGNLNKTGAGILALAGSNTISGSVNLNTGTLQLANANAITSTSGITSSTTSAVIVTSGTTIQLRANANTSFNTGLITLPGGTVNIDVANNGSGTGNTLTLGTANVVLTGSANGAITTVTSSNTTLNISGSNGYGLTLGRLQQPSGAGGSSFIVNASAPVSITQFQTGSFGSNFIAGSGTITLGIGVSGFTQGSNGNNSVTVNNGATLIMATAIGNYNTRTGGNYSTVLNSGGSLVLNNAGSLANSGGTAAPTLTINGGTLDSTQSGGITITAGTTTSPTQTWNGDFTFTGSQNLNLGNGAVTMVGTRQVTVSANTLTIGGAISGAGLTKAGAGILVLGGANTYDGLTTVSAGTLQIGSGAAVGTLSPSSAITNNATLAFNRTGTITQGTDFANVISGTGAVNQIGSGTLVLSGLNTYADLTTVSTGVLQANHNSALGTTAGDTTVASGAELQLGNGITITGETLNIAGGGLAANLIGALRTATGANAEWAGTVNLGASTRLGAAAGTTLTVSGAVNGSQPLLISGQSGTGTVLLTSTSNGYTGATQIIRGLLKIGATNALPTGTILDVDFSTASEVSTFDLNGFDQTVAGLQRTGAGGTGGSIVTNSGGTINTLEVNQATTTSFSGSITGNLALTKSGAGALTLTASNTYTGATAVNDGTLLVNNTTGSGTGTNTVSVASGATLGGTGTIAGAVNVTGVLSPGASIETLGTGALSFANGSTLAHELDSSVATSIGSDLLKVTGNLNLVGSVGLTLADLAVTDVAFNVNDVFSLINYTGSLTGGGLLAFGGNDLAEAEVFTFGLNSWRINYTAAEGGLNYTGQFAGGSDSFVNLTVVPEPSSVALLGTLGAMLLLRRRR